MGCFTLVVLVCVLVLLAPMHALVIALQLPCNRSSLAGTTRGMRDPSRPTREVHERIRKAMLGAHAQRLLSPCFFLFFPIAPSLH